MGVLLVVAVSAGFGLGVGTPTTERPHLDALARDVTTVLGSDVSETGDARVVALARSERSFERSRTATRRRVERLLPADVAFRVRTPHGSLGYPRPPSVTAGVETVPTRFGPVTVWVWYG